MYVCKKCGTKEICAEGKHDKDLYEGCQAWCNKCQEKTSIIKIQNEEEKMETKKEKQNFIDNSDITSKDYITTIAFVILSLIFIVFLVVMI